MTTYWTTNLIPPVSSQSTPHNSSILIIGSGLAGTSTAYFLLQQGYTDVAIVDCGTENASYFRNAGHILHGACENYQAMSNIHGRHKTKTIFQFSEQFCREMHNTITSLSLDCDYHMGDYLFIGKDAKEESEILESVKMMQEDGFDFSYVESDTQKYGFAHGMARGCRLSAQANPAKFRNQLLAHVISRGVKYYSHKVMQIDDTSSASVTIKYYDNSQSSHDAIVIAANAYSPQFSKFFEDRKLVDPFKGQIIVSAPMQKQWPRMQFSMDHGYVYGTITVDNRLLIGGWRNNIPGGETGSFDLNLNPLVEQGLKEFVKQHFLFEDLRWEHSWAGIMGSSQTGFPFVGPTNNPMIYTLAGCTGYGFGWFHGAAHLLADIMMGNPMPEGYQYFNPNK